MPRVHQRLTRPREASSTKRNPVDYVSLVDDANIGTNSHRIHSYSKFDLTFTLHNGQQKIRLALEPNHDLFHKSFSVIRLDAKGNPRTVEQLQRTKHKVYKGDAFIQRGGQGGWSKAGFARITVHRDGKAPVFDGSFRIDGNNHHVQTGTHYQRLKHDDDPLLEISSELRGETMVVWRDSDVMSLYSQHSELKREAANQSSCASDSLSFNSRYDLKLRGDDPLQAVPSRALFGRQSIDDGGNGNGPGVDLLDHIGSTDGCPSTRKVALVGIATDCTYWDGFDNEEDLRSNVISMVNQASEVYESTFEISLGIQNLTISDQGCPGTASDSAPWNVDCSDDVTINDRLDLFSAWRGQFDDTNAYWSLLTTCATESAVGLAWRGQLCRPGSGDDSDGSGNNQTVAAANVVVRTSTEWQVFAHETGHTFGAVHDCTDQSCPASSSTEICCPLSTSECDADGAFIMNPSTGSAITRFSPCSIGNICAGIASNVRSDCLTDNQNIDTISGSQCGNGIVETGEDCDCGGDDGCASNSCCDADTCTFTGDAVCDPTNEDCCTDECQFASSGTVCRSSTGECDVEESCPGDASNCPDDGHMNDGDSCGDDGDGLRCAGGQCTSRDLQCQNLAGSLESNNATSACGRYDGCAVTCNSPDFGGSGSCATYNQNFVDGTPCGAGGRCSNGDCEGSSTSKQISKWIREHLEIVIPVACVVGILVLLAVGGCIVSCIRRRRRRVAKPAPDANANSWPMYAGGNWASNGSGNGNGNGNAPPPMSMSGANDQPHAGLPGHSFAPVPPEQQQWLNRQQSTRYA